DSGVTEQSFACLVQEPLRLVHHACFELSSKWNGQRAEHDTYHQDRDRHLDQAETAELLSRGHEIVTCSTARFQCCDGRLARARFELLAARLHEQCVRCRRARARTEIRGSE